MATTTAHTRATDASRAVANARAMVQRAADKLGAAAENALIAENLMSVVALHERACELEFSPAHTDAQWTAPTPETLNAAVRLARAERELGVALGDRSRWVRLREDEVGPEVLARRMAHFHAGDEAERADTEHHQHVIGDLADSTRQIVCRLRAALRTPAAFRLDRDDPDARCVAVPATETALAALLDGPWNGVERHEHTQHLPDQTRRVVAIGFRRANREPGIAFLWAPLATTGDSEDTDVDAAMVLPERVASFSLTHAARIGRHAAVALTHPISLFGEDRCEHTGAEWIPQSLPGCPVDSLRLECRECHRRRVAIAPLHRLDPAEHPIDDEAGYLRVIAYRDALAGIAPTAASIADLRERDGVMVQTPSHYRIGASRRQRPGVLGAGARRSRM